MDEVRHEKQFSMTFCLDCHRELMPKKYIVKMDEHGEPEKLDLIAKEYGLTASALAELNGVSITNSLEVGQKVNITSGDPNKRLRPLDKITDLAYDRSSDPANKDRNFVKEWHVKTSENCSACHR
jgi:hypothetical protein